MTLIARTKQGKINFFQSKIAPWTTNATAIGTTSAAVTALDGLVDAAAAKLAAQTSAEATYRTAVAEADQAVGAMYDAGAAIIAAIRAKALTGGDAIYNLAQLPVPAHREPKGQPGKPYELVVELDENGALILKWKCANPPQTQGTFYQIFRNDLGNIAGPFKSIGVAGGKTFTDSSVPAGATAIVYKIQACRTTGGGLWATFNVVFGANTGGTMVTAIPDGNAPKVAA